uniref:Uncharacterized protein n=1 Tax=Avena sativa TaxID=4498 RepID=A0ACD6AJJ2_AVESA
MTSAVLAGRNEVHHHNHHWGDARVPHMPKPSNPNHRRHRPSPNPSHSVPRPPPPPPSRTAPAAAAVREPSPSGRVLIRPSSLSRREAREVRARLTRELGRVRALLSHIDTWEDHQRPLHAEPPPQLREAMLNRCAQILTKLRKQRNCVWFNRPVDVEKLKLHDYHAVIRNPMDLGTVKANLATGRYHSHEAFADDVRLTFNNALRYNPVGHEVHRSAGNLLANFEGFYKEAVSWFEQECEQLESTTTMPLDFSPPRQPLVHVPVQAQPVPLLLQESSRMGVGKRPKPKAREPNKREMSEEEMHKLRVEIESLPEEKMVNVLQIVQKRSTDPALRGDVVELDFDEMDVETLWELDRFVVNCKKVLKKSRPTAEMNGDAVMAPVIPVEDGMVMVNVDSPTVVEIGDSETDVPEKRSSEAEMIDEYVDIGDEMPAANYQSVEIEKDAQVVSSSSGSDSGSSSSSDSASRSSGDFDSDGDDARSPD